MRGAFVPGTSIGMLLLPLIASGQVTLAPATMARVGTVDERFQSYNLEMVEVTGGRFWKPYAAPAQTDAGSKAAADKGGNQPTGMAASLYMYRPPIDLSNARLRKMARALGPAYLRVSGTWANSTYFQPSGAAGDAPAGFKGVLTGAEWKGVVEFAKAADDELVTSFATSAGTRDGAGLWTPVEAQKVLAATRAAGGRIAAAEFMNEPTFAEIGGAPKGYDAAAFAKDFAVFHAYAKKGAPEMVLLGPGGVGEGTPLAMPGMKLVATADIFAATGPVYDVVSYHSYGGVSSRCGGKVNGAVEDAALSAEWLSNPDRVEQFYARLRDQFEPGKPLWNTETAQAACGGDKWASTFLDTFRYLNQLGDLAKRGVRVQMHNTLAASDYGLLDENTYEPRPNYWAALLWRRLMGTTVLEPGSSPSENLHLYAHCLRGGDSSKKGGVVVLAINASRAEPWRMVLPMAAERYTLSAAQLMDTKVLLNGAELQLGANDALPELRGQAEKAGEVTLAPASITFLTFPGAANAGCR